MKTLKLLANTVGFGLIILTAMALMHVLEQLKWVLV